MRKKKKESANRTYSLGPNLSFLDIVQDACSKGGRYTLTVEADGASYIVLVDRGGPFNVSGAGVTGLLAELTKPTPAGASSIARCATGVRQDCEWLRCGTTLERFERCLSRIAVAVSDAAKFWFT